MPGVTWRQELPTKPLPKKKKGSLGILDALHSYEQKMISLSKNKKDAIHVLIGVSLLICVILTFYVTFP